MNILSILILTLVDARFIHALTDHLKIFDFLNFQKIVELSADQIFPLQV